jgi:hypothetical protein
VILSTLIIDPNYFLLSLHPFFGKQFFPSLRSPQFNSALKLLFFQIQFSLKLTCCYISSICVLRSTHHKFQFSSQFTSETREMRPRHDRKNKFSRKLFSFLSYVADLIQIFFFFALFSYPFRKLFFLIPPLPLSGHRFSLSFSTIFQRKFSPTVSSVQLKLLLFIVVCEVVRSGSLLLSGIETLSHVISDK